MVDYQAWSLGLKTTNTYLDPTKANYTIFIISVIIIQISVAFTEENIARGFLAKRGSEYTHRISAVLISALYFGLGHFAYFIDLRAVEILSGKSFPIWFPILWFLQALLIGIILALLVLRRKWLIPVIIAHSLNNIVSAQTIWSFFRQYPKVGDQYIIDPNFIFNILIILKFLLSSFIIILLFFKFLFLSIIFFLITHMEESIKGARKDRKKPI